MRCSHSSCKNEAAEGLKQCEHHSHYARRYQKKRRYKMIDGGLCTRCGGESRPNKTMCQKCADEWNEYLRNRRKNNG